ncbi:MAG: hypothetical protein KDB26_12400 [Microthrixaceae bacterium]|nr:hypothetical protein [Microthrixaceae bacterium]
MPPYDPLRFADTREEYVWCRVTVTVRATGEVRETVGDYLNLEYMPRLRCGIEEAASALGLIDHLADDDLYVSVCAAVTKQLALMPWAHLTCPTLTVRIDLLEPPT